MQPDPTPEISQEAARAMLAALTQIAGALEDWWNIPPPRENTGEERALVVAAALSRAAIALAEGRAS
jgi:hypothetical protein